MGSSRDVIADFEQGSDRIGLSALGSIKLASGNVFNHVANELTWSQQDLAGTANDTTIVSVDRDGDGVADMQIQLTGLATLTVGDVILQRQRRYAVERTNASFA